MKHLIAAVCIALIAGGAYYGATRNAADTEQKERTRPMRDAENAFYDAAGAKAGETEKVRTVCANFARDPAKRRRAGEKFSQQVPAVWVSVELA